MEMDQIQTEVREIEIEQNDSPKNPSRNSSQSKAGERAAEGSYTLSEVGEFLNVNESTLRNWEKRFGEFLTNFRNQYNHRMFTDADVAVLERIKYLLESGLFTVAGVKHMLTNQGNMAAMGGEKAVVTQVVQPNPMDEEYKQKLLFALNSLGSEVQGMRREIREDLRNSLKSDIDHLKMLLFPPEQPKKAWWKLF